MVLFKPNDSCYRLSFSTGMTTPETPKAEIIRKKEGDSTVFAIEHNGFRVGERVIGNNAEHLQRAEKKIQMVRDNGWALQANGEMVCIYCKHETKGFERGIRNQHNRNFNPMENPCTCRL